MSSWQKKLKQLLTDSSIPEIAFDKKGKFILFSDIHRGVNDWSDDFANNENLYFHALGIYLKSGFTCIELGDCDELWENRDFDEIRYQHRHIFWRLKEFYDKNRYYMIYGNHDIVRKNPDIVRKTLYTFRKRHDEHFDDDIMKQARNDMLDLFKGIKVTEGVRLRYTPSNKTLLLIHGHQPDTISNSFWRLARFFVRYFWKWLQNCGIKDPTSPAKNHKKAEAIDKKLKKWIDIEDSSCRLISGHTHKPRLLNDCRYANTGSCVHPRCITGIKIENGTLNLIKWTVAVQKNTNALYIKEEYLVKGIPI